MPLCPQSTNPQKPDDPVEAALRKVNEAVHTAEKQLDKLDTLPSARMPRQVRLYAAPFIPQRYQAYGTNWLYPVSICRRVTCASMVPRLLSSYRCKG